jgi:segregation and condensation protein A
VAPETDASLSEPDIAASIPAPASEVPVEPLEPGGGSACAVKLPAFEGPLDLLLHLIRSNEVDISDIPIALISQQYLEYLDLMRLLDIDLAADYLVMAATLAWIKSRMLLPPDPDGELDDDGLDPRAELARRLAEYAVFREVAVDLGGRPLLNRDVFAAELDRSTIPEKDPVLTVSLFALIDAMKRVLENIPEELRSHEVLRESLTVQDRMVHVMDRLRAAPDAALLFEELLVDGETTRHRVVITFLAILELAKIQALRLFQNMNEYGQPFGPVRVHAAVDPALPGEA